MKKAVKKTAHTAYKEPGIREDIRRLGVLVEAGNDKWDLIAEQYEGIQKTLDEHTQTLDEHTQILDEHTQILDKYAQTLEMHTEMFGKVFVDLSIIKEDIEFIKSDLKKKVDIDQFAALEKRVAFLERKSV